MADEQQQDDNVEGEENILYDFTVQAEWPQEPETVVCPFCTTHILSVCFLLELLWLTCL